MNALSSEVQHSDLQSLAPAAMVPQVINTMPTTPMEMLALVLTRGADLPTLEKFMDLQQRWEAGEARKAFVQAMALFKADPPQIVKDKHVEFETSKGRTSYSHATLGALCAAVINGLAKVGISHSWSVEQENRIKVTCKLTHELGHSETVSLQAAPDDSGGKNSIQAIGSAVTYLQRYTLFAACGLAPVDDDDGEGSTTPEGKPAASGVKYITAKQAADLIAKIEEVGVNKDQFRLFLQVESFDKLLAKRFDAAIQVLNDKARGAR